MQVDRQGLLNATAVKTEDLDTYDSDCDDISNPKAVLMANISNYGSDVISEVHHSESYLNDMENQSVRYNMLIPSTKSSVSLPVQIEVSKELPKISLVNESLKKLKLHLANFDKVVKIMITPTARTEGEWGFEHNKAVFNNEIIPFIKSLKDIFNVFDIDLLNEIICSKHVTGNQSQLMNFISKFLGTVRFGNDHIARIMDLEVAFRKNTCFIRNLKGVDLISESRDTNLYTISLDDMLKTSSVCILSKASKAKSWLCHCHLSHLNFDTLNKLAKDCLARGIPRLKFQKGHLCSACALVRNVQIDNGTKFVNQTLREFYENVRISHQTSVARTPQDNGIVERQNWTLVEAAHTMLIFSKALLFLWAKAINTARYTQNRSLIRIRYNKTPYERMKDKKPDLSFFHIFGALCYPTNDNDDLGKLVAKADIDLVDSPVSTSTDQDAPSTQEQEHSLNISQGFEESPKTLTFRDDPLHEDSTSQGSSSNMRQTHTPFESLGRWTMDHPKANVIGDPSRSVSIRKQLQTDDMWYYFDAFLTSIEPKNFKQEMIKPSWIDAMQEKIYEFERLQDNPWHVYKLKKALWSQTSTTCMVRHAVKLPKGAVDPTLFTQKVGNDLLLVQIYVDDIIFTSTNTAMCNEFANLMTTKFKMSMMGKMSFFLGLQISQSPRGIFINQSKYAFEIIKKYGMLSSDSIDTPLVKNSKLDEDLQGKPIDATLYRGMIGSLMYQTSSRPDLTYAVCLCARYQEKPIEKHINKVKQIFRYLKGTINMALWYSKDTNMSLTTYADEDHARIMYSITAQQAKLELEVVPKEKRLEIRKCNRRLNPRNIQKEPTFHEINSLNDIVIDHMHQHGRNFAALINKIPSGKTTGLDKLRLSKAQIL
uniref:Retrovirus-related Pol polyprotein from transposon TNT 1-94 n=1 Tax=Tanacetum cinerariifolium TaxID=118510 RepID=A0A6L2NIT0_TANCI|nr:retrovirus-related Pol polyprotein from transposon TNT 1-94 [Tanacetum cinerariifolium]